MSKNKPGFTLIEVVIIIPIALFVVLSMITAVIFLTNQSAQTNLLTRRSNDLRSALDIIEQDISLSNAFLIENSVTLDGSQKINGQGFSIINSQGQKQLILKTLLTTDNPIASHTKKLVHEKKISDPNTNCSVNPPLYANTVYYVEQGTLYRRLLMPVNYQDSHCEPSVWQQPSCRPVIGDFCQTEDMKLLEDAELDLSFMTPTDPDTAVNEIFDTSISFDDRQKALNDAEIVRIKLTTSVSQIKGDKPTILINTLRANRIP